MEAGKDVMELLPYLSAYMGHAELTATLYYVHMLPEKLWGSAGIDWKQLSLIYGRRHKMRIKAKDPALITLIGEFLKVYLSTVKNRDGDTIDSYRHSINLYLQFLQSTYGTTIMNVRSCDFNQENIVAFMSWLRDSRGNVATTVNHRLSDIRSFCRYFMKKGAVLPSDFEEIREISDVIDDRDEDFTWLSMEDVKAVLD